MPDSRSSERKHERGQVIVLFALGLVVLLGVLAVILDGGRVYTERRRAQNAADAAATAGAAFLNMSNPPASITAANITTVETAACKAAASNGFGSGSLDSTCGPTGTVVQIHVPTASSDGLQLPGVWPKFEQPGYVQVTVTSNFQPFFAGVFGYKNFAAAALAVAVNIPGHGVGFTLLVLDPIDCGAFSINGGTVLDVKGGGVQVDSSASRTASTTCTSQNAATLVNNSTLTTENGPNNVVGTGDTGANPPWTDGADFVVDPLSGVHVPYFPDANHPTIPGQPALSTDPLNPQQAPLMWTNTNANPFPDPAVGLPPGVIWGGITVQNNDNLVLQGGTYIMAGGGFNVAGGQVSALGPVTLIYTQDLSCNTNNASACDKPNYAGNGDLPKSTTGQPGGQGAWGLPNAPLQAPGEGCTTSTGCLTWNATDPYLNGILMYVDRNILPCTGTGNTTLVAGGGGTYAFDTGSIIYAPCSTVKLYGNGTNYGGAVVSYQISINGTKTLNLGGPGVPIDNPSKSNLVQ